MGILRKNTAKDKYTRYYVADMIIKASEALRNDYSGNTYKQAQIPAEVGNMEMSDILGLESPNIEEPFTEPQTAEVLNTKPLILRNLEEESE